MPSSIDKTAIAFLSVDFSVTVRASPVSVSPECTGQSRRNALVWDGLPCDYSERQSEVDANVDWTCTQLGKCLMMVAVQRIEPVKRTAKPGSRPGGPSAAFFPST
jgi:hypothetical protein